MEKDNHNVDLENLFWQNTLVSLRRGDKDISPVFINVRLIGEYAKGSEMLKVGRRSHFSMQLIYTHKSPLFRRIYVYTYPMILIPRFYIH